jgi:hypothetical protein
MYSPHGVVGMAPTEIVTAFVLSLSSASSTALRLSTTTVSRAPSAAVQFVENDKVP